MQTVAGPVLGAPAAEQPVLVRIAESLEILEASMAATPVIPPHRLQEEPVDVQVPRSLAPLLAAGLASAGHHNGANIVVSAVGFPEGHADRGLAFAALNAVLSVASPHTSLAGLSMKRPEPHNADANRTQASCQEHRSLSMQVVCGGSATFATMVQSVARGLRHDAVLRRRHGQRFLAEVSSFTLQAGLVPEAPLEAERAPPEAAPKHRRRPAAAHP